MCSSRRAQDISTAAYAAGNRTQPGTPRSYGAGRAAEWIWRNDQHENTTVLHTLQLFAQQLGLCPSLPCMGHEITISRRVIAVDGTILESDTRSQYDAVVGQL